MPPYPLRNPEVENVVKIDVGEDRADARSLRGTGGRFLEHAIFQNAGLQPEAHKPQNAGVGDPVSEHPLHPGVVNAPEEVADVRVNDPVHPPAHDGPVNRPQRIVGAASGAEPERAIVEVDLIDRAEDLSHSTLDDLVFECRDAERPPAAIGLRDICPPDRVRSVAASLQAAPEGLEPRTQVPLVFRYCHPIHAGRRPPSLSSKRAFERRDVKMVEKRREPALARPLGRVVHPNKIGMQGYPALRLDLTSLVRDPRWSRPSLRTTRFLRRHHQYYTSIRHPQTLESALRFPS